MRYGACTWIFADEPLAVAARLAALGYDGVELFGDVERCAPAEVKTVLGDHGLAGGRLFLFHAADSNRQAVGRGYTDFPALLRALRHVEYDGAIIVECTASGPDPFTPVKGDGWREVVEGRLAESVQVLWMWERTEP